MGRQTALDKAIIAISQEIDALEFARRKLVEQKQAPVKPKRIKALRSLPPVAAEG